MRETGILLAAGCLGLAFESALLAQLPAALVPGLSLLFPVAAAVLLGPIEGVLVCAALGFGADMFSGALLGQHAFLRLVEFAVVRALVGQLDLARPIPFSIFAFGVALADAAGSAALIRFFLGEEPILATAQNSADFKSFQGNVRPERAFTNAMSEALMLPFVFKSNLNVDALVA